MNIAWSAWVLVVIIPLAMGAAAGFLGSWMADRPYRRYRP